MPNHGVTHKRVEYAEIAFTFDDQAACKGMDVEVFFPEERESKKEARAKRVCSSCPIRGMCLTHAIENKEKHGIWGGTTPAERDNERRRRARKEGKAA